MCAFILVQSACKFTSGWQTFLTSVWQQLLKMNTRHIVTAKHYLKELAQNIFGKTMHLFCCLFRVVDLDSSQFLWKEQPLSDRSQDFQNVSSIWGIDNVVNRHYAKCFVSQVKPIAYDHLYSVLFKNQNQKWKLAEDFRLPGLGFTIFVPLCNS